MKGVKIMESDERDSCAERKAWELTDATASDVLEGRLAWKEAFSTIKNPADGSCGLWAMFVFALIDVGMDAQSAQEVLLLKGASPVDTKAVDDLLMLCRQRIVDYNTRKGSVFFDEEGPVRTAKELDEICRSGEIKSMNEWNYVVPKKNAYLDEYAVCILGELMGLPDTTVVTESTTTTYGIVDVLTAQPPSSKSNHVWYRKGHFEALVPKVNVVCVCCVVMFIDRENQFFADEIVLTISHVLSLRTRKLCSPVPPPLGT